MPKFPLRVVRNTAFSDLYERFITDCDLTDDEYLALLKLAVVFLNNEDTNIKLLGYRIIVIYSNKTKDFVPLYDVSLNKGYMPIIDIIEKKLLNKGEKTNFFSEYYSSLLSSYRVGENVFTEEQLELKSFFGENNDDNVTVTAPTSYGKSDLIAGFCAKNPNSNICVVVPTKALLAQTRQRLLRERSFEDNRTIITHHEMLSDESKKFVAVFTQERLLRFLVKRSGVNFDYIFIDEAHNILDDNERALLLAQVIIIQKSRNSNAIFKYLTPFLVDQNNLKLRYTPLETKNFKVDESLKTEKYYLVDFRSDKSLYIYDQFLDEHYLVDDDIVVDNEIDFLKNYSSQKNIVFFNSPKKIEIFHRRLVDKLISIENDVLDDVCDSISEIVHKDYFLIEGLKKGVVYHHGSVPDIIKLFIEKIYTIIKEVKYLICNSTLLEGVNIPAEKLFILENKIGQNNLSKSQFRNLTGRICRFSEIFHKKVSGLTLLEPEIYLIGTNTYIGTKANIRTFIKNVAQVDKEAVDNVENVLLDEAPVDTDVSKQKKKEADDFLNNVLPDLNVSKDGLAVTELGVSCYLNNISEIDILNKEHLINASLDELLGVINDNNTLLSVISNCFIEHVKPNHKSYYVLKRLQNESAQNFYAMLFDWKIRGITYAGMINSFLNYWEVFPDEYVYVGKWGEVEREGSHKAHWVKIHEKNHVEKINLAIVRIKEEQDFIENNIMKYVEVLNDLKKLNVEFYTRIKYGTTNEYKIFLMNLGIQSSLANKLIDGYSEFIEYSDDNSSFELNSKIIDKMKINGENSVVIFEACLHCGVEFKF